MTFDKFLRRNRLIAEHLAQIARKCEAGGWLDDVGPANSALREVLAAQERLLTAAERLLDSRTHTVPSNSAIVGTLRSTAAPAFAADSH